MSPAAGRILLAIAGVLFTQTLAGLLWAGSAAERLSQIEDRLDDTTTLLERTARLEEQGINARESLLRIEAKLDREERR